MISQIFRENLERKWRENLTQKGKFVISLKYYCLPNIPAWVMIVVNPLSMENA